MSHIYDDKPKYERLDGLYSGRFANDPSDFDDPAFVIIPTLSKMNRIGPCPWTPVQGTSLPTRDDPCLVGYDEKENPYVIAWWPQVGGSPGG